MRHRALVIMLALPLVVAATARGDIYLRAHSVGGVPNVPDCGPCIVIQSLQFGGQVVSAASPWTITPPFGIQSVTLTKARDGVSAALSMIAARPNKDMGPAVEILVVFRDDRGGVRKVDKIELVAPTIQSFTSSGSLETIVLGYSAIKLGGFEHPKTPTPTPTSTPTPAPPGARKVKRPL